MLTIVQVHRDGYHLDCWVSGGKNFFVDPPEHPFFYDRNTHSRGDEVTKCLLSQPDVDINIFKVPVGNVYEVRRARLGDSMECEVRFVERLAQDFGFKQSDMNVRLLAFDSARARGFMSGS